MQRKAILFAVLFLVSLPFAHADDASKRAKIEEMFKIIKMDSNMTQLLDMSMAQSKDMVKGMLGDVKISESDQKIMDASNAKVIAILRDSLGWERLRPAYVDLYASAYTEEEVDGILAFYKSPIGQSMLAKTPDLMTKGSEIVSLRSQEMQPKIRAVMDDLFKQLGAAHADKTPAKP